MPISTPTTKLSHEAAQALYDKIEGFDRLIDDEIERVKGATATISGAYAGAGSAYATRQVLAEELGRLAPDDFTPQSGRNLVGTAPASPTRRFYRAHPFPQPRPVQSKAPRDYDDQF